MKKTIIAATAAALIAGTAASFAASSTAQSPAPAPATAAQPAERAERWHPTPADQAALTDARIAALKAGLKLTPDQEKLWPTLETTLRDVAKDRQTRMAEWRKQRESGQKPDEIARLRFAASAMSARAADLQKIADAADPLYKTLDEGQKHRLQILLRQDMPHGPKGEHRGPERGPQRG